MNNESALFNDSLATLRQNYVSKLSLVLQELSVDLNTLETQPSQTSLANILITVHKMAGSAGTFGFSKISELARQLEAKVNQSLNDQGKIAPQKSFELHDLIKLINSQLKSKDQPGPSSSTDWEPFSQEKLCKSNSSKTVIIVDDDRELIDLLGAQLSRYGYHLILLNDYRLLHSILVDEPASVIVMDIMFPGYADAGINTIVELRKKGLINCPVLFTSARDDFEARLNAMRAGGDWYFHKPVLLDEFVEVISRMTQPVSERKYRVLVVDDNEEHGLHYTRLLSEVGIITQLVTDPMQALFRVRELQPDVILLDIMMPGCSGFEMARVIRQHEQHLNIPIIFLTARAPKEAWFEAMLVGGDDFLHKSVNASELITTIMSRAIRSRQLAVTMSKLRLSESRFRSVMESAGDAIITLDDSQKIINWNRSAQILFGYTSMEMLGSDFNELIESQRDRRFQYKKRAVMLARRKNSDQFPVDMSTANWVADGAGFTTYIIRDISKREQYERDLREAKQDAENANKAKSEFLSSMSHELRTPLNAVLGFGQMLSRNPSEPLTQAQTLCVEQIVKGGEHLLDLINEILDLAKIEAGKVDLIFEPIAVGELIEECLALVKTGATQRNIHYRMNNESNELPPILADYTRLKQVLLNLFSNATQYNRNNGTVIVDYQVMSEVLRISIADSGIGIEPRLQSQLFQPFSRLGAEASQVEGTGIGLSVSKKLVEQMHGSIGFTSQEGSGSTFWVDIPLAQIPEKNTLGEQADKPVERLKEQSFKHLASGTLLYVEDDPGNLSLMEMVVSQIDGLELVTANSAEEGIEIACRLRPALIILDISLPGMSGYDALKHLQKAPRTADIPVIAISASAMAADIEKGLRAGFHQYLTKPIQIDKMMSVIASIL
jgi:PAS domain S-box-containing protein